MKTILVDDEQNAIELFLLECANIPEVEIVGTFTSSIDALDYASHNPVDIAVLDVEMPEFNGIELGKRIKEVQSTTILIYVSAYDVYAMEAYRLHAPVYLEKPYSREDVQFAFQMAKQLLLQNKSGETRRKVFIRTFDYFDVYVDDQLVHFKNKKSKELLAILVDRKGAEVSNEQAISVLWEDAINDIFYQSKYRRVVKDLRDTLKRAEIEDIVISHHNSKAVDVNLFNCDYYWLLKGDEETRDSFNGKYMSEYSWAEDTLANIAWNQSNDKDSWRNDK